MYVHNGTSLEIYYSLIDITVCFSEKFEKLKIILTPFLRQVKKRFEAVILVGGPEETLNCFYFR